MPDEDLAITDLAAVGALAKCLDDAFKLLFGHRDLDLDLGQKINDVFGAAVELGVSFLSAKALDLAHRNALHADFGQCLAHVVEFEWLDDRHDHFHRYFPRIRSRHDYNRNPRSRSV